MTKVCSKINESQIICSFIKKNQISNYRVDLSPPEEFLQVCARKMNTNVSVPAHKHKNIQRNTDLTQESWVILQGEIKAEIFNLDGTFLQDITLESGDCITFYRGGHSLICLQEDTLFYEFKNGPYYGAEIDKESL